MKNLFLLILTLFLVSHNVSSQNTKFIDSLKLELESRKTDDSIKVSILAMLHEKLMFSKPEEAKKYAEQELEISKKINYKKGLGAGNMHLGNYYANRIENDSAIYYFNKAKSYFKEINSQRGIIFINHSLASIEGIQGNYDNAIALNEENIKLILETEKGDSKIKFIGAQYSSLSYIYIYIY